MAAAHKQESTRGCKRAPTCRPPGLSTAPRCLTATAPAAACSRHSSTALSAARAPRVVQRGGMRVQAGFQTSAAQPSPAQPSPAHARTHAGMHSRWPSTREHAQILERTLAHMRLGCPPVGAHLHLAHGPCHQMPRPLHLLLWVVCVVCVRCGWWCVCVCVCVCVWVWGVGGGVCVGVGVGGGVGWCVGVGVGWGGVCGGAGYLVCKCAHLCVCMCSRMCVHAAGMSGP